MSFRMSPIFHSLRILSVTTIAIACLCFSLHAQTEKGKKRRNTKTDSIKNAVKETVQAVDGENPIKLAMTEGLALFQQGEYDGAAVKLAYAIDKGGDALPNIEQLHYLLTSSLFNANNYEKAIDRAKVFMTKFPTSQFLSDVTFALAQSFYFTNRYEDAIAEYIKVEKNASHRDTALLGHALCSEKLGRLPEAISACEQAIALGINSPKSCIAAIKLVSFYRKTEQREKARQLLGICYKNPQMMDYAFSVNTALMEMGDEHLAKNESEEALSLYRFARKRNDLLSVQSERLKTITKQVDAYTQQKNISEYALTALAALKQQQAQLKESVENLDKTPDYDAQLYYRLATAFSRMNKPWESIVALDEILNVFPQSGQRPRAMFSLCVALNEAETYPRLFVAADNFLTEFPQDANADKACYLKGAAAAQLNKYKQAAEIFLDAVSKYPKSEYADQFVFLAGNCLFESNDYAGARKQYERYIKSYPKGVSVEECHYRTGLSFFLQDDYTSARVAFRKLLDINSATGFAPEAQLHLAMMLFSEGENDKAADACRTWLEKFDGHEKTAEVGGVLGDSLAGAGQNESAVVAYKKALLAARGEEDILCALPQLRNLLQKMRRWDELISVMEDFKTKWPTLSLVTDANLSIANAIYKKKDLEGAQRYLVKLIADCVDDASGETADRYILQLVSYMKPKKPERPAPPPPEPEPIVDPNAPPPAPKTPEQIYAEKAAQRAAAEKAMIERRIAMEKEKADAITSTYALYDLLLEPILIKTNPTGKARIGFGRAQLCMALGRKDEAIAEYHMLIKIAFPADFSPPMLALIGEALLQDDYPAKAEPLFNYLVEHHLHSAFADVGWLGLGEIALKNDKALRALECFTLASENEHQNRVKEAVMGLARTCMMQGEIAARKKNVEETESQFKTADQYFDRVLSTRAWRGELYAQALFLKGQMQMIAADLPRSEEYRNKHLTAALAYFSRVYLAYQKYPEISAQAYLRAGDALANLQKINEQRTLYEEMLANKKIAILPVAAEAQKRLDALPVLQPLTPTPTTVTK